MLASAEKPSPRAAQYIVFFVVFLDLLGFGIVLPLLPRYANAYFSSDTPDWLRGVLIGLLYSSFSAMQFIFSPIWGRISDRVGRRPILLIGLAGSVVFYTLFGLASELPSESGTLALILLFVARTGAGIAGASVATAQAVIADVTTPENRAKGMGLIGAAFGIGFTFGPLIAYAGLLLAPEYRGMPGYLAAGLSLLALLAGLRLLPETRHPGEQERRHWLDLRGMTETLRTPTVGLLVLIFFLSIFAFANFEGTLSLFTQKFGYQDRENFLVFAFIGFVLLIAQGLIYRRFVKQLGEVHFLQLGTFLMLGGLAALAYVGYRGQEVAMHVLFFVGLTLAVSGFAFLNPSVQALVSRRSDPARQGEVLGVNQGFAALARILGPLVGLSLFPLTDDHSLPYALAASLLVAVALIVPRIR